MDDKLIAAIEAAEEAADSPNLADDRAKAIRYYNGEIDVEAPEGRSNYVSRDVHNAVESVKPSVLAKFVSSDVVVKFNPTGPEDVKAAEQETEYINYLFTQKNNGFLILSQWFHDALLSRNGYVKVYWDEREEEETERYASLSPDEVALLLQDQSIEVVGQEINEYGLYALEVKRKKTYGCVKVDNLPPENCLVDHTCPSVDVGEANFFGFWDYRTISYLREMGFDVPDDINDGGNESYEEWVRNQYSDSTNYGDSPDADPSMRMVKVRECWIKYDEDEDGKAELLHCIVVGTHILLKEGADVIPVAAVSPYPMPHRHVGRSVADDAMHYQELKSYLIRNYNDNLALVNHGRYAISDRVNLSDMLVSRPGGVVRVEGEPAGAVMPLVHPSQGPAILQGLEYFTALEETDTGVTRYNQGMDANSLNKTATGISKIMNASQMRIDLIARNFAEVGVKRLFWLIHKITKQNATQPEVMRLRNEWIAVDPRSWKTRYDMSISVGLGTGDKDQQLMHLQSILLAQKEGLQIGVARPENIYYALTKLTENAGFKDVENFWTDPQKNPPQPQPNPEEVKMQAEMQKFQAETQIRQQEKQMDAMLQERMKAMELQFNQWKAQLDAETKITIAQISASAVLSRQQEEAADMAVEGDE
jgi:hypothetical protein